MRKRVRMHMTADDFISLLEPHYSSAVQYCRALYGTRKDAEDGLQDSIIAALKHFKTLRDESKFKAWLFTIITRTFYRSQKKHKQLFVPLQESHNAFCDVYKEDSLGEREKFMLAALHTLPDKERTAILLFEIGGLSLEEIKKAQMEKSLSAVKSRLSRTRQKLRNIIIEMEKNNHEQGGNYDIKTSAEAKRSYK